MLQGNVEMGNFRNVDQVLQFCIFCNEGVDVCHFIFDCVVFKDDKNQSITPLKGLLEHSENMMNIDSLCYKWAVEAIWKGPQNYILR